MPELEMIPYESHMGADFVPYDAIEWQQQQLRNPGSSLPPGSATTDLPIAEKMAVAGLSVPKEPWQL